MLSSLVATLTTWLAPWQSAYAGSKVIETGVVSVHLVALLLGGGLAVAVDRAMLRALRTGTEARRAALDNMAAAHRTVLLALGAQFMSGVALAAADVNTFAHSPVFLVKLTLVALLCANGSVLFSTEQALQRDLAGRGDGAEALWKRLAITARISLTLWTATVVAGITLVNAG